MTLQNTDTKGKETGQTAQKQSTLQHTVTSLKAQKQSFHTATKKQTLQNTGTVGTETNHSDGYRRHRNESNTQLQRVQKWITQTVTEGTEMNHLNPQL